MGKACTANLCIAFHDGAVVDIIPAPHISNTVLSVGGRIWALWKSVELVKTKLHSQIFLVKRNGFSRQMMRCIGRSCIRTGSETSTHPISCLVTLANVGCSNRISRWSGGNLGYHHFYIETTEANAHF